jgi:hypothetical protein
MVLSSLWQLPVLRCSAAGVEAVMSICREGGEFYDEQHYP